MQYDCQEPRPEHNEIQNKVAGAGLKCSVIQLFAFLYPANDSYSEIGHSDASHRATEQHNGEEEPIDIIDGRVLTGELEQRRVVTVSVLYHRPAAGQPHREPYQNRHQHQRHRPRTG